MRFPSSVSSEFLHGLFAFPKLEFLALELADTIPVARSTTYRNLHVAQKLGWVEPIGRVTLEHGKPATVWRRRARLEAMP